MNSRERIKTIIDLEEPDRCGLWLGHPLAETAEIYFDYFKAQSVEEIRQKLGDDFRFYFADGAYKHPEGRPLFGIAPDEVGRAVGPFSEAEVVEEIESYEWPDPDHLDFTDVVAWLKGAGEVYRAGGLWTHFFHVILDLFGMESYLIKLFTHPEVVHAVTDRVCQFYYEANARAFEACAPHLDGFFFGNDFGTQRDLIVSPTQFDEFILPWMRKFATLAHDNGLQVILHCCGAVHKVIDRLIDAGVDCLHPLQAQAHGMDAETLARDFKGRIAFFGAVDVQNLLVNGEPEQVKSFVRNLKKVLGPHFIVSASHEAVLPDVPPQNLEAMAKAAVE